MAGEFDPYSKGVEYQVTKVDPTDPETKGMVYQVHKVSEEVAATLGGKVYRARIINDPTQPTIAGKVYQIVLIDDPDDPSVKGKVYNAILTGGSEVVVIGPAVSPLVLPDAIADSLYYVKAFGGTEQDGTPTPDVPVDIVTNNGALKYSLNELDPSEIEVGYYRVSGTGVLTESEYNFITGYMPVNPGQSYVFFGRRQSDNKLSSYNRIHWFDANKGFISTNSYTKDTIGTGTAPSNAYFAQCSCNESGATTTPTTQEIVDGYNWVFQQGSAEVAYIPYVEGGLYTDGPVETIRVRGNNLLAANVNDTAIAATPTTPIEIDFDLWYKGVAYNGYANTTNIVSFSSGIGTITFTGHNNSYGCARFVKLRPNTTYAVSCSNPTSDHRCAISCYVDNGDGTYTPTTQIKTPSQLPFAFTTNSNVVYGIIFYSPNDTSMTYSNIQLEQGSTATAYEPYYSGGTATAQMLLKVGDYQDWQEILSGAVTRNIGVKVLDGTENWVQHTSVSSLRSIVLDVDKSATSTTFFCTHYTTFSWGTWTQTGVSISSSGRAYFCDPRFDNVNDWKSWLVEQYEVGNPVILVYPLSTPTTESVAGQTLQVQQGDNYLEITQAGMDGLELEAQYDAAVSLTIQEAQDRNLDNNVTVTIQ